MKEFDTVALNMKNPLLNNPGRIARFNELLKLMYQAKREGIIEKMITSIRAVIIQINQLKKEHKSNPSSQKTPEKLTNPGQNSSSATETQLLGGLRSLVRGGWLSNAPWELFLKNFLDSADKSMKEFDKIAIAMKKPLLNNLKKIEEFNALLKLMYQAKRESIIQKMTHSIQEVINEVKRMGAGKNTTFTPGMNQKKAQNTAGGQNPSGFNREKITTENALLKHLKMLIQVQELRGSRWKEFLNHFMQGNLLAFDAIALEIKRPILNNTRRKSEFDDLLRLMYRAKREGIIQKITSSLKAVLVEIESQSRAANRKTFV